MIGDAQVVYGRLVRFEASEGLRNVESGLIGVTHVPLDVGPDLVEVIVARFERLRHLGGGRFRVEVSMKPQIRGYCLKGLDSSSASRVGGY